jgi:hypothetical protein
VDEKKVIEGFAIVVLDKGFVYVGEVKIEGEWLKMTDAKNIRYWGTENGLGQLALNGPTEKTKLDSLGSFMAPLSKVIHVIDSGRELWK